METLELPVAEETADAPPADLSEQAIDLEAFQLWRQACRLDHALDGEIEELAR